MVLEFVEPRNSSSCLHRSPSFIAIEPRLVRTRSSGLCKVKVNNHIIVAFIQKGELFGYAKILDLFVLQRILFAINTQPGFTKREKKRSLLKSLKILYVKKMSQRQKGMQNSLGKPPHC
ncbi:hypothetical protein P8452_22936 [Trifolium repens]|nr:hypothetical protein P8452_22936 [Trifolium repens]